MLAPAKAFGNGPLTCAGQNQAGTECAGSFQKVYGITMAVKSANETVSSGGDEEMDDR